MNQADRKLSVMVLGLRGFPNVQGGVEKHAEMLYPRILKHGCSVTVLGRAPHDTGQASWRGVRFLWLWAPRIRGLESLLHSFLAVMVAGVRRPDILHVHAIGPGLVAPLARALGLRVVITHHGPDYEREKWGAVAKSVLRLGERLGMKAAHARIAISETIRKSVAAKYGKTCELIPNGVERPSPPADSQILERFGLERGRYVLQVSRLVPEKRQLDLVAAFDRADLAGWKLVLVGDTEFPDDYSRKVLTIPTTSANVVCTGFQTGEALGALYAHSGMFVLPSSHEGLPIVLLEALGYGLPVVASDISANKEVGLPPSVYFALGDIDALASRLRDNARDPGDASAWAARRAFVESRYDWDRIAEQTVDTYRRLVAE